MSSAAKVAELLNDEISKVGMSELRYSTSLFSGNRSSKPDVYGSIAGKQFRVIMFENSANDSILCASGHFTLDITSEAFTASHLAYWNTDNRFTKMYKQEDQTYLVMDVLFSDNDRSLVQSALAIWASAIGELRRLKSQHERMSAFD